MHSANAARDKRTFLPNRSFVISGVERAPVPVKMPVRLCQVTGSKSMSSLFNLDVLPAEMDDKTRGSSVTDVLC